MDAEQIAASLTKAQREALFCFSGNARMTSGEAGATGMAATLLCTRTPPLAQRQWAAGLDQYEYRLTPLGLAVRTILKGQTDGE